MFYLIVRYLKTLCDNF